MVWWTDVVVCGSAVVVDGPRVVDVVVCNGCVVVVVDSDDVVWGKEEEVVVEVVVVVVSEAVQSDKLLIVKCPGAQQVSVEYCLKVKTSPSTTGTESEPVALFC